MRTRCKDFGKPTGPAAVPGPESPGLRANRSAEGRGVARARLALLESEAQAGLPRDAEAEAGGSDDGRRGARLRGLERDSLDRLPGLLSADVPLDHDGLSGERLGCGQRGREAATL